MSQCRGLHLLNAPSPARLVLAGVLAALLLSFAAAAQTPDPLAGAQARFAAGDYLAAAADAAAADTAAGDALTARALLAAARTAARAQAPELIARARAAAERAIERDPALLEGHLQLAVALGYQGRAMGHLAAHSAGLALRARQAIDAALARAPGNRWALAVDGTWHLEIVAAAGPLLADALYGAREAAGLAALRRAVTPPEGSAARLSPVVVHQCALQLMAYDARRFGAEAARWLDRLAGLRGRTALERAALADARRLARAWRAGEAAHPGARRGARDLSLLMREVSRQQRPGR